MGPLGDLVDKMGAQASVPMVEFTLQLGAAAVTSALLAALFVRCGRSPGNRRALAMTFVPLTLTTMFVIAVVKSSLALSLGLVGALSIVRFRTAIREPEELVFLFICIGLGLAFGANQWGAALAAFGAVAGVILLMARLRPGLDRAGARWLLVQTAGGIAPERIESVVRGAVKSARLTRVEIRKDLVETAFDLELDPAQGGFGRLMEALRQVDAGARCVLLDQPARPVE